MDYIYQSFSNNAIKGAKVASWYFDNSIAYSVNSSKSLISTPRENLSDSLLFWLPNTEIVGEFEMVRYNVVPVSLTH